MKSASEKSEESLDFRQWMEKEYDKVIHEDSRARHLAIGPGWHDLIVDILDKARELDFKIKLDQVKEKFGGLRFYWSVPEDFDYDEDDLDELRDVTQEKESESFEVCESCGTEEDVETKGDGWVKTYCETCREASNRFKENRNKMNDLFSEIRENERERVRTEIDSGKESAAKYEIVAVGGEYTMSSIMTIEDARVEELKQEQSEI